MKKTLVALAVAAVAATSANAAVVYNQDGTKVEVGGSVRLILTKEKEQRTDLQNAGSRLEVRASHDLGEGLKALAYGRLNLGNEQFEDNKVTLAKLYAGFSLDNVGAFTFGRQDTNGDDVGLSDYTYNLGGINQIITSGKKVARFTSAEFHGLKLGLDYVFGTADKEKVNDRGYVVSAFYDRTFGDVGFAFHAGYSHQKVSKNVSNKAFTLATELSYGPFAFAVDYSQAKSSNGAAALKWHGIQDVVTVTEGYFDNAGAPQKREVEKEVDVLFSKARDIELGLKYQVTEKSKLYTVVSFGKAKIVGAKDTETVKHRNYIFGADYKVHPQVVTYLEGGLFRTKGSDDGETYKDHKVNLGLRVFF